MRVGSLCTGYGGIELGLALAGVAVELRWVSDVEPALDPLYGDVPNLGDIRTADFRRAGKVDLLTAGFPCQPVSAAGAQLGRDDPRWLWPSVHRAVATLKPHQVLIENVRNLAATRKGALWSGILADLAALGYHTRWLTLGACHVGAAHHRHRLFALATRTRARVLADAQRIPTTWCGAGGIATVPTPSASDAVMGPTTTRSGKRHGEVNGLTGIAALFPTPAASAYGSNQGGAAGRVGPVRPSLETLAKTLFPTPTARDGDGRGTGDDRYWMTRATVRNNGKPLDAEVALLPTPRASDAEKGRAKQRGGRGDLLISSAVQPVHWGRFAEAVAVHEVHYGPAPAPTEPNRNGAPRLSPAFAEWLMCLPPGHVTSKLTRTAALRAIGNGVCPPQLAAAWALLNS